MREIRIGITADINSLKILMNIRTTENIQDTKKNIAGGHKKVRIIGTV